MPRSDKQRDVERIKTNSSGGDMPRRPSFHRIRRNYFRLATLIVVLAMSSAATAPAWASIVLRIQLSQQTMQVTVDGADFAIWPVSTARPGYRTPTGTFRPYALHRMHYSSLYDWTPMPYSMFFYRGFAIHGTTEIRNLGRAVSHGCVRLSPANARAIFELVRRHGAQNTQITIVD